MILLRTERDRPAVFIEHLSHYAGLSVKTLKSCTVLADIQWTTARPNAVYKDIRELFLGFSVYVAESETECKMVQQKWKRYERATHIM